MEKDKKPRVLIVDDMPVNRMILSSLLASNGVESDLADGGKQCVELCEKNRYDLILLDHRMPDLDGVDTLVRLKEIFRKNGSEIPIVCHTTEDARKNINLYKAAGFADVLIKPIQPQELSNILMTWLPGNNSAKEQKEAEEKQRVNAELSKLPDWAREISGIDAESGINYCETAEDYMDALKVFTSSIKAKSDEIEEFFAEDNLSMYALRVHSLKSTARLVGAKQLSEHAADLERAAKDADRETVQAKTQELLDEYRDFDRALAGRFDEAGASQQGGGAPLPGEVWDDAISSITDFTAEYDADSIRMVLDSLSEYDLTPSQQDFVNRISGSVERSDWGTVRACL